MEHSHMEFHRDLQLLADREIMDVYKRDPVPDVTTVDGTVYSVVFTTAQATFSGVIGGYTTLDSGSAASTTQASEGLNPLAASAAPSSSPASTQAIASSSPQTSVQASTNQDQSQTALSTPSATVNLATLLSSSFVAVSTVSSISDSSSTAVAPAAAATSSSAVSSSSSSKSLSAGATAGIAIAVLALVALVCIIALLYFKKQKNKAKAQNFDNEKPPMSNVAPPSPMLQSSVSAPRLDVRPVSKLLPEFMTGARNRNSAGNALNMAGALSTRPISPQNRAAPPMNGKPENPFSDPQNPFADPERDVSNNPHISTQLAPTGPESYQMTTLAASTAATPGPVPRKPVERSAPMILPIQKPEPIANPVQRKPVEPSAPVSLPIQMPEPEPVIAPEPAPASSQSPAMSTKSSAAQSPVPAPAPLNPQRPRQDHPDGNVYRVTLDFNPSLTDELALQAGQLVRMLHEYDDGWCLCIRLDRSQQGVVPRTCLAANPSKPRPAHLNQYARNNGANTPQTQPRAPMSGRNSPAMSRPMSPARAPMSPRTGPPQSPRSAPNGRPGYAPGQGQGRSLAPGAFNQAPRPLSPGPRPQSKRSQSPGPYGAGSGPQPMGMVQRRRSNSVGGPMAMRGQTAGPSRLRSMSPGIAM